MSQNLNPLLPNQLRYSPSNHRRFYRNNIFTTPLERKSTPFGKNKKILLLTHSTILFSAANILWRQTFGSSPVYREELYP
jgi:hypothetical protein